MDAATTQRPAGVFACPTCTEPVRLVATLAGASVTIDPELVRGGLYALDGYGRAIRRPLTVLNHELRGIGELVGGYDPHECARDTAWFR